MQFPYLSPSRQTRAVTDVFRGYDHRLRTRDGSFYNTENLSSRQFPLLCTRQRRGLLPNLHGLGVYDWGIHIDCREAPGLAKWDSRTKKDD